MYPRVLKYIVRCVKTSGFFSLDFEEHSEGQYMFVRTWDLNRVVRICVCIEPKGQPFPDAEIRNLSRILSCVGAKFRPLMISGLSSVVLSFYNDSNKKQGKLLCYTEYSSKIFTEQVQKVGGTVFGLVDPFTLIEFLVWKLKPLKDEPWIVPLVAFRQCLEKSCVEFEDLPAVVLELLTVWNLIREAVGSTVPKAIAETAPEVVIFICLIGFDVVRLLIFFYFCRLEDWLE